MNKDEQSLEQLYLFGLTKRQREVVSWAAKGLTNREVGLKMNIRPNVVADHLTTIYELLGNLDSYSDSRPNRYTLLRAFIPFFERNPRMSVAEKGEIEH